MSSQRDVRGVVLVVEDTIDTRLVLTLSLQHEGYAVVSAANGEEAVEIAKRARPDLILMDLNMPRCDGLSATRRIREDPELRDVQILALTAYDTHGMRAAALASGCNGYLTKPLGPGHLEEIVGRFMRGAEH